MKRLHVLLVATLALGTASAEAQIRNNGPGNLAVGTGRVDSRNYAPGMRFPLEDLGWLNSQIHGVGGYMGPSGGQCDSRNYSYPWVDNYCESRRWSMPLCPSNNGHQGQDIRPATCVNNTHAAVATVNGTITSVGYSTKLVGDDGTRYDYLHMSRIQVRAGQRVDCGDVLGYVSNLNSSGVAYTTYHLHFTIRQAVSGLGSVYVPPFVALVDAGRRHGSACGAAVDAGTPDTAVPPAGSECFSSTLGRNVDTGQCVQVEGAACGASNCGVYQCVEGRWACPVSTCTQTFGHASCMEPEPAPDTCRSTVLGRDVDHGECVQVGPTERPGEPAACASGCGWYQCDAGGWSCTDVGSCGGATNPNASCTTPPGRSCRSTVLGRNVDDGTCVQVDSRERPGDGACDDGCGWFRCDDGTWACTEPGECAHEQFPNDSCMAGGASCASSTLGRDVNHGDCVQVSRASCGMSECAWYQCANGSWACSEASACAANSFENEACGGGMGGGESVADVAARGACSTSGVEGISAQLAETQRCMHPDSFVRFAPHAGITLSSDRVHPYAQAATRDALHSAAASTPLTVNSAFRTVADQYVLRNSGGCGVVAEVGRSNHQSGRAVDIANWSSARRDLERAGCDWFGASDNVHFDCPGMDLRSDAIAAFQRLWNANNPDDTIAEDGIYGSQTAARLGASPAGGFARDGCMEGDTCDENEGCGACNRATGCGWCETTSKCESDAQEGSCERWYDDVNSCEPCEATECGSCAASGFCVWCPGVGCVNDSIPVDFAMCSEPEVIRNPGDCG